MEFVVKRLSQPDLSVIIGLDDTGTGLMARPGGEMSGPLGIVVLGHQEVRHHHQLVLRELGLVFLHKVRTLLTAADRFSRSDTSIVQAIRSSTPWPWLGGRCRNGRGAEEEQVRIGGHSIVGTLLYLRRKTFVPTCIY
jgi:hypothetical protein